MGSAVFRNDEAAVFPLILLICIFNGVASPLVFTLFQMAPAWVPGFALVNLQLVFYLSSLATSTLTLLVSGIPAALFERFSGRQATDPASAAIWMAGAAVLTLPAIHGWLFGGIALP